MQYEFLKNFPQRMKNVGLYAVLIQNSMQKTSWKQFGFAKFDEQIADFGQLEKDYAVYESNRAALEKCKKEEQRFQENQKLAKERQAKLLEEQKTAQNTLNILEREAEKLNEKYTRYATYEKAGQYTLPEEISVEQMEARYEAITSVLSQELKDLEERETKASCRFQREQNELEHLQKKYRLKPVQWADVIYDRKEE